MNKTKLGQVTVRVGSYYAATANPSPARLFRVPLSVIGSWWYITRD